MFEWVAIVRCRDHNLQCEKAATDHGRSYLKISVDIQVFTIVQVVLPSIATRCVKFSLVLNLGMDVSSIVLPSAWLLPKEFAGFTLSMEMLSYCLFEIQMC